MIYFLSPVISNDASEYFNNIKNISCFMDLIGGEYKFVACIQDPDFHSEMMIETKKNGYVEELYILRTNIVGVSNARNNCLDYILKNFKINAEVDVLTFYDSKVVLGKKHLVSLIDFQSSKECFFLSDIDFVDMFFLNIKRDSLLFLGVDFKIEGGRVVDFSRVDYFRHCYLSSWAFKLSVVQEQRFNENWGPGDMTEFKSGEDVFFLNDLFFSNKNKKVLRTGGIVYRERRPVDLSKHIDYAFGHGAVLGFVFKLRPFFYGFYLFLFVVNSIRFLFLGKRERNLAVLRLLGLWHFLKK